MGNRALFFIDCPTPQRSPLLDRLHDRSTKVDLAIVYRFEAWDDRGWGAIAYHHTGVGLPKEWFSRQRAVIRAVRDTSVGMVAVFGYARVEYVLAILISRLRRLPLVMRSDSNAADEDERPRWRKVLKGWFLRSLLGRSVECWVIGKSNERYWREFGFGNIVHIPYSVPVAPLGSRADGEAFRTAWRLQDAFVIAYIGRLIDSKGILDLLEAFQTIQASDIRLVVVGQGPLASEVERRARNDTRIVFLGPLEYSRLGPVYRGVDLVVVPSRKEPWGLVVNEAVANGTRVLASSRVASADDILDDERGSRFEAGNVADLKDAIANELAAGPRTCEPTGGVDVVPLMLARVEKLCAAVPGTPIARQ